MSAFSFSFTENGINPLLMIEDSKPLRKAEEYWLNVLKIRKQELQKYMKLKKKNLELYKTMSNNICIMGEKK